MFDAGQLKEREKDGVETQVLITMHVGGGEREICALRKF